MPNIPAYNAPALDLRPSETGIDALQTGARRIGAFYSQAANDQTQLGAHLASAAKDVGEVALKHQEFQDVTSLSKNFATMLANKTKDWNDLASQTPPERMGIAAAKFRESIEPDLEKFGDGALTEGGQRFAQSHVATLRQHLWEKTQADTYHAAGEAAKVNTAQTVNQLASAARLDPSSLDFALQTAESTFEHLISTSGLTGDLAARFRTEGLQQAKVGIVKSAVLGMIEKNPDVDLSKIQEKYSGLISGAEMSQFEKAQKAQIRTDNAQKKQDIITARQIADLKVHREANQNFADNVKIDPTTGRPIIDPKFFQRGLDIVKNNPDAPSAASTARTTIDWGEHQQNAKEVTRTNPETKADLMTRMFDPDKPTNKMDVLRAEADGKLSNHDSTVLREMVTEQDAAPHRGPVYQSAIEAMKERVGYGLIADGHERFSSAMQVFWPEYNRQLRAGTLQPNALDLRDPKSLISQSIEQFKPPLDQLMIAHSLKNLGVSRLDQLNLTAPGTTVTGVKVENAPAFKPPANWQYNAAKDLFHPAGNLYDRSGRTVKEK